MSSKGFTLVEVVVVVAIIAVLSSLALPGFSYMKGKAQVGSTAAELSGLQTEVISFNLETGSFPDALNQLVTTIVNDAYGRPYQYLRIETNPGLERENGFGLDLNTDFDLYSLGLDGVTAQDIDAPASLDDVVRATDGTFFGLGERF